MTEQPSPTPRDVLTKIVQEVDNTSSTTIAPSFLVEARRALADSATGPLDVERLVRVVTEIGEHRPWLLERAMGTPNEGLVLAHEIAKALASQSSRTSDE